MPDREPWDELRQHRWGQVELAVNLAAGVLVLVLAAVLIVKELRGKE